MDIISHWGMTTRRGNLYSQPPKIYIMPISTNPLHFLLSSCLWCVFYCGCLSAPFLRWREDAAYTPLAKASWGCSGCWFRGGQELLDKGSGLRGGTEWVNHIASFLPILCLERIKEEEESIWLCYCKVSIYTCFRVWYPSINSFFVPWNDLNSLSLLCTLWFVLEKSWLFDCRANMFLSVSPSFSYLSVTLKSLLDMLPHV